VTTSESNRLYDTYLERCLAGEVEPPARFCERHGATSAGLRRRLDTLYDLHRSRVVQRAEPAPETPDAGLPFERLGEFRLLRQLGEGGMGRLYLAEQESLGRRVALKIVKPELRASPTAVERFRREAFAVAKLQHPNIVRVIATGEDAGVVFLAMELVPGRGLDELIEEAGGPLPWRRVAGWIRAVAAALAYAHDSGVLHRDVKPANIRITPDDRPVLVDFGLARDERWSGQTLTRAFAGSPLYAAPEQLASRKVDGRVDVYALGVTLFEAVTGRLPFPEGPADQLLHRVLTEEPLPPRRLQPDLPRDLETVTLKALQKSPRDRYASAAAFGADLEAVLEDRPIAARPPGPVTRLRRWARRRPWPAALGAAALVVLLALAGFALAAAAQRRADARGLVADARTRLAAYRGSRAALQGVEERVVDLQGKLHAKYFTEDEDRLLEESENAVARARREREVAFYDVLELLRRAQELDPGVAGVEAVRAELYLQRWHEARAARDEVGEEFYRELVERHDPAGRFEETLHGRAAVKIDSDPPGASVYLFRFAKAEGEQRLVPVPAGNAPPPVPPGTFALRVVRGTGDVRAEDLILEVADHPIRGAFFVDGDRLVTVDGAPVRSLFQVETLDAAREHEFSFGSGATRKAKRLDGVLRACDLAARGGVAARLYRNGRTWTQELPPGLEVRTTAAPFFVSDSCLLGTAPITGVELDADYWFLIVRKEGFLDQRVNFRVPRGVDVAATRIELVPASADLPGFRRLPPYGGDHPDPFWIMEREVTCGEYLAFLNDPETRARIDAAEEPVLFPRDGANRLEGGFWERGPDGRFALGDWPADWPVLGVSWHDAQAYAAWRTKHAPAGVTYRLPTLAEWDRTGCGGSTNRSYPWGNRFRPKWTKSCYAQRTAVPEPVLRYPIDESVHGVYDMAGGAREWLQGWFDESKGLRAIAGGSWANAQPDRFKFWGEGLLPDLASGVLGFRLVAVREK
jgi:formylglycine-generating enzyme required for sulfatase activity